MSTSEQKTQGTVNSIDLTNPDQTSTSIFEIDWPLFLQTGYLGFFQCSFGNADWWLCITSGYFLPYAFITGFWGTVKILTVQFGIFSQIDVPTYEGEVYGVQNVQIVYYLIDSIAETFWILLELSLGTPALWTASSLIVYYNIVAGGWAWLWPGIVGVMQWTALLIWAPSLAIRLTYSLTTLFYLVLKYDAGTYHGIPFYDPINIWQVPADDLDLYDQLIWWEQLLLGNKRSMMYANFMMGTVLCLHPMTFMLSWFFWAQLPVELLLDGLVYPLFPQFDSPFIPWVSFVEFLIGYSSDGGALPTPE